MAKKSIKVYRDIEQRTDEWYEIRKGKVTGTFLSKIVSSNKNTRENAYYELIAGRLSTATVEQALENALKRGVRLEDEAIIAFEKKTKIKVERVGFVESSFSKWIGYSPDGLIMKGKKYSEDIELKCLGSGKHVKAWMTGSVPEDYADQIIQGFITNDDLQVRHVVFYDPRIAEKPLVIIKVERKDVEFVIKEYKEAQLDMLDRVEEAIERLVKKI